MYFDLLEKKKNPSVKLFSFSKELSFLRNNINFLTNLSVDQTDSQFQIPSLEQNLRSALQ